MNHPLFSVIIPTFNRPELLVEALDSVHRQAISDWECIVVDDCGSLFPSIDPDERVRYIRRSVNGGAAAAINSGVEVATGQYLTFIADDDIMTADRLQIGLMGLSTTELSICLTQYIGAVPPTNFRNLNGNVSDCILDKMPPSMGAVAIRRDKWLPLREDYRTCEDVEWWLRTASTVTVATVPKVGYLVRAHSGIRHLSGYAARRADNERLMIEYATWFGAHKRAHAFRLRRSAYYSSLLGEHANARRTLWKSIRLKWSFGAIKQLILAFMKRFPK